MTREMILKAFRDQGCHAYQAEFAAEFLGVDSAPHHLLVSPDGLGRVSTASLIVKYMVAQRQARRILIVAPAAFGMLWRSRLQGLPPSVPVMLVHTQAYRELKAKTPPNGSPWPEAIVAIVPTNAASRAEIRGTLAAVPWDLIIVGDLQQHSASRPTELLEELFSQAVAARSLLITSAPLPASQAFLNPPGEEPQPPWPEFQVTSWMGELPDWDGRMMTPPPIDWRVLDYTRSDSEIRLLDLVQEQLRELEAIRSPFQFQTGVLLRRAASSGYAVEQTLRMIGMKLTRVPLRKLVTVPEEEYQEELEVEDVPRLSFTRDERKSYLRFVKNAYVTLKEIESETKLACLLRLLGELSEAKPGRICVLAGYADTVSDLQRALSQANVPATVMTGGLKYAARQQVIETFSQEGQVLLTTLGALGTESDLSCIKHVVHFDLPPTAAQLSQIEGRFGRIKRAHPCKMYALQDLSGALSDEVRTASLIQEAQALSRNDSSPRNRQELHSQ